MGKNFNFLCDIHIVLSLNISIFKNDIVFFQNVYRTKSLANIGKREILWTNPNLANAIFPSQTISIDLSDADEIEIYCCVNNSVNYGVQIYRFLFVNGTIAIVSKSIQGAGNYNTLYIRQFTMYSDRIVIANGATQASTGTNAINNNAQVPFKIVKIKY